MSCTILIPTSLHDVHALAVDYAINKLNQNVRVIRWFGADFPSIQNQTFKLENGVYNFSVVTADANFDISDIDLIWFRRPGYPIINLSEQHPDHEHADRESRHFFGNTWEIFPDRVQWVNNFNNARRADNKFKQLRLAVEVGLKVPSTLSSSDPTAIRGFFQKYNGNVIYKSFSGVFDWEEEGKLFRQYAAPVTPNALQSDEMLKISLSIYQEYIAKKYEIRILYIDGVFIACKINANNHHSGKHDWRASPRSLLKIEPYEIPYFVKDKIKLLMQKLGLVTGSIDMIVSEDDEYVFLEVNESGQFLWMELENPEIKVLGPFIKFLVEKASNGKMTVEESLISAVEIFEDPQFETQLDIDIERHVENV